MINVVRKGVKGDEMCLSNCDLKLKEVQLFNNKSLDPAFSFYYYFSALMCITFLDSTVLLFYYFSI